MSSQDSALELGEVGAEVPMKRQASGQQMRLGAGVVQNGVDIPCMHRCDMDEGALRELFESFDENGDGFISKEEMDNVSKSTKYYSVVRRALKSPEYRNSEKINYSEFSRYIAENASFSARYGHHIEFGIVCLFFIIIALAFIYGDEKEVECSDNPDPITLDDGHEYQRTDLPTCTERWTVIDTMYFGAVTVTTVGYGDFGPSNDGMKVFTIFAIFIGVGLIGSIIAGAASEMLEAQQQKLLDKMDDDPDDLDSPHGWKIFFSIFTILIFVFLGAIFFALNEDWTYLDAVYWSFVTTTTVGYGDLSLEKESSRLFSFFYIITSTMVVAGMLGNLASIKMEMEMEKKQKELLARKLDMSMIAEMDKDGDGVDAGEFLAANLVWLGKVTDRDCEPILAKFHELDEDGSHLLDADDLAKLKADAEAAAAAEAQAKA
mmetsp:Transcript_2503/g.4678  ORF Transcript_2503/g.4678 Transcript_2503/m.4678 type:complete len:433 (-) Transcript_2503:22-1320(-)